MSRNHETIIREQPRSILKSAAGFLSGTLLSRVGGLARDVSMAYCFGITPSIAAFLMAYRFSNLLRRIFGEGVLLNGFIPLFEASRKTDPAEAARFFRDLVGTLVSLLILFVLVIEFGLGLSIWLGISPNNQEIVFYSMLMLPGLLFVTLYSLFSALLQCEKKYFLSGVAPLGFNLIWIAAIWMFYGTSTQTAATGLSIAIVMAFFIQWLVTLPEVVKYFSNLLSWKELLHCRFFSSEVKKMLTAISLGVVGVSANQLNNALDFIFARAASLDGPAFLNYAIHLYQLPLALFGIGMTSALLPPLARTVQKEDWPHFNTLLEYALSKTSLILLPCTGGIFALGAASVALIYTHGNFDSEAAVSTTLSLWAYGIGLFPAGMAMLLSSAFYAKKDFRTPAIATVYTVALNFLLNVFCIMWMEWGFVSVAIATSISSFWNAGYLYSQLNNSRKVISNLKGELLKLTFCSVLAASITITFNHTFFAEPTLALLSNIKHFSFPLNLMEQIFQLIAGAMIFGLGFIFISIMLNFKEFRALLNVIFKKKY